MTEAHPTNPLHGVTLEIMLNKLVERVGWKKMAVRVQIRCFMFDPTIKSSLVFLRRTPWARKEVEKMYLEGLRSPLKRPNKKEA